MTDTINPIKIYVIGFDQEVESTITKLIHKIAKDCSTSISTKALDGITFARNYKKALEDIERGHEKKIKNTPSNDYGVGIAMSIHVTRNDQPMHHIVINGGLFISQIADNHAEIAINTVAHELAHTDLYNRYETVFPGELNSIPDNFLDQFRNACMLDCWNEFGACWMSAKFGPTNVAHYESSFLAALKDTKSVVSRAMAEYQIEKNNEKLISTIAGQYKILLKYSAYHLGNLYGHNTDWKELPTTANPLKSHWFSPFFNELDETCQSIARNIDNWTDSHQFDSLRELAEKLVAHGGLSFQRHLDGQISFEIKNQ